MTYASLMVYVDDEADNVARIGFARDLAAIHDATLIGISVSEPEPPLVDAYVAGGMAGEILTLRRDQADGELSAAKARFLEAMKDTGIDHEWRAETGYPASCVSHHARAADLILVGRDAGRLPYRAPDAGDLIMNVGRPVLVAPPRASAAPVDGVVLVAWKEGREAQRAVQAALPLLKQAREVKVVEICASADAADAAAAAARVADVAAWLRRHGVIAESEAKVRDERPAGDRILALVEQAGANLIVSGAWGHSRMREWVLGGVTQALLNRSQSWLLLSH